jgi:putative FmdB family regulatory protein
MPIYQYRCNDCNYEFEQRQRMSDDALTECPVCHGHIRRVLNSVGVVFKGSGFYVTDTRGSNAAGKNGTTKTETKSSETSEPDKSSTSENKTESKTTKEKTTTTE